MKIGTKVHVNYLSAGRRVYSTGSEQDLVNHYGTVTRLLTHGYCTIEVADEVTGDILTGSFCGHELDNFGSDWPKYRIGDTMRICNISEREKRQYPVGWYNAMDEHIGQVARIERHGTEHNCYKLEGIGWIWHDSSLEPVYEFIGY